MSAASTLISVTNLKKYFPVTRGILVRRQVGAIKAVDDISFEILRGETLGLVGESGCGKTTAGRTILQLYRPTSGSVCFNGVELTRQSRAAMRRLRADMQIIFQDPYASLNPRWTISRIVGEPLRVHHIGTVPPTSNEGRILMRRTWSAAASGAVCNPPRRYLD